MVLITNNFNTLYYHWLTSRENQCLTFGCPTSECFRSNYYGIYCGDDVYCNGYASDRSSTHQLLS